MLKRILCALLVFMLLPVLPAMAEESDADILTLDELRLWVNDYKIRAMTTQPLNDPTAPESLTEDGYAFVYDFATLYMDIPEMSADSVVQAMVIYSSEETGLRGVNIDDSAQKVLAAYYTENGDLVGNSDEALLYAFDLLPEGGYIGVLHRDGQRIQVIDYAVYEQPPTGGDGYTNAGVTYTLMNNNVTAIRVYGLNNRFDIEGVAVALERAQRLRGETTYSQVFMSFDGSELAPFDGDDLIFAGIHFAALTPEDAVAAFGDATEDVWLPNGEGWLRMMQFTSCEAIFSYDNARQTCQVTNMTIDTDLLEGPRSVRVGDTVASVINRFRNGEGDYDGMTEIFYGSEEEGVFGSAEYRADATVLLRYGTVTEENVPVVMYLFFSDQSILSEILLMVNE